ncbi:hypothetical protein [Streptomyces sp. NRRL WC-3549]|uniref:hypothetical protein n=1 Tax=Streptomyces sp. NRRL WC-3549 TaxID=1463925 RepID=UPI0004C97CC1|nr:hypothetical protein [Streptomyces sp. NRRL WC-3549]
MHRGLVHAAAWSFATGAAVTLSWWGVHTVMSGTAYDRPRAVPIAAGTQGAGAAEAPVSSSTHRPSPSPPPTSGPPATRSPSPPPPARPSSGTPSPGDAPASAPPAAAGNVQSHPTRGGRVVLELAPDAATLVSATPEPGWSMRVWTNAEWIRVDFTDGSGATVSVFCTWNGHPPSVEVVEQ